MISLDTLPRCSCGRRRQVWNSGGASISPYLVQQSYVCNSCKKVANFMAKGTERIFFYPTTEPAKTEAIDQWINGCLMAAWRDRETRLEQAREPIANAWVLQKKSALGIPPGMDINAYPLKEKVEEFFAAYDDFRRTPEYLTPPGFENRIIPPQMPEGIAVFIDVSTERGVCEWQEVGREESLQQPVPPDPIRVHHDAYYAKVFTKLKQTLGCDFNPVESPNQYCGNTRLKPWYTFKLGEHTVIMGPRKRVTHIEIASDGEFDASEIRKAAEKANVTFSSSRTQGKQNSVQTRTYVHAWFGQENQIDQFLEILGRECLKSTQAVPA